MMFVSHLQKENVLEPWRCRRRKLAKRRGHCYCFWNITGFDWRRLMRIHTWFTPVTPSCLYFFYFLVSLSQCRVENLKDTCLDDFCAFHLSTSSYSMGPRRYSGSLKEIVQTQRMILVDNWRGNLLNSVSDMVSFIIFSRGFWNCTQWVRYEGSWHKTGINESQSEASLSCTEYKWSALYVL